MFDFKLAFRDILDNEPTQCMVTVKMSYGEKVLVTTVKENYIYPNGCHKNKSFKFSTGSKHFEN